MARKKRQEHTTVRFADLGFVTRSVHARFLKAIDRFLKKGVFILSDEVTTFEKAWARYCGVKYAVGASSGADALYLALHVLDIGPGDEVITQGNAYNASVTAILRVGATPRFADVDPETLTIDPEKVSSLINSKTKAILPVHLFGAMGDMEALRTLAERHKLAIIEDAAQAHGASFLGKKAGAWGTVGCFSFYPTKNLGAFGDGGAVTTNDPSLYARLLALRNLGQEGKNNHTELGYNMRLGALEAIALSLKLPMLAKQNALRRKICMRYEKEISKLKVPLRVPKHLPNSESAHHLFVVELQEGDRSNVMARLKALGVETAIHYPLPVYRQPFYVRAGLKGDACPIAELSQERILSLPLFVGMTAEEEKKVLSALANVFQESDQGAP